MAKKKDDKKFTKQDCLDMLEQLHMDLQQELDNLYSKQSELEEQIDYTHELILIVKNKWGSR